MSDEIESSPAQWNDRYERSEYERVRRWRIQAGKDAGLNRLEAELFADGDGNTAALRGAAERGASHDQLVEIFT